MLLWIVLYRFLCVYIFLILLLGIYLAVEFLGGKIGMSSNLIDNTKLPKHLTDLYSFQRVCESSCAPHPRQHLVLSVVNFSHPGECEVVSHGGFKLNFLADWRGRVYWVASFTKCLFRCFAQFSLGFTCLICSSIPKSRRLFLITPCGNLTILPFKLKSTVHLEFVFV